PCLSQSSDCTSRPGPSAEGLMPKAARERVASPRAGTALARAIRLCLPGHVRLGEIRRICNLIGDERQAFVTITVT
ncbi:MAG: hypothetical protein WAM72_14500, partial [Xanthobacteraceae bacterium]